MYIRMVHRKYRLPSRSKVMSFLSTFDHTNSMTDNIIYRDKLQQQLVDNMIEGMDFKTMWQVLDSYMMESFDKYTDEELVEEVKEYYPELLEEN